MSTPTTLTTNKLKPPNSLLFLSPGFCEALPGQKTLVEDSMQEYSLQEELEVWKAETSKSHFCSHSSSSSSSSFFRRPIYKSLVSIISILSPSYSAKGATSSSAICFNFHEILPGGPITSYSIFNKVKIAIFVGKMPRPHGFFLTLVWEILVCCCGVWEIGVAGIV